MTLFKELNGTISWRKIITAGVLICFMAAQIGYLITHNFDQLPAPYWGSDAGVIVFYFSKQFFEGVKITNK